MTKTLLISFAVFIFAGAHLLARQKSATSPASPCSEPSSADKKSDLIEYDPFVNPANELRMRTQKNLEEKNFKELQDSATELAILSSRMSKEIDASGQFAISLRVLDDLDQIEKLAKKVRSRAK